MPPALASPTSAPEPMEPEPARSPFHPPQSLLFAPSSYLFSDLAPLSPFLCVSLLLSPSLPSSDSVLSPTHCSVPGTVPRALDPGKAMKQPSCLLQAYPFPCSREPGVGAGVLWTAVCQLGAAGGPGWGIPAT